MDTVKKPLFSTRWTALPWNVTPPQTRPTRGDSPLKCPECKARNPDKSGWSCEKCGYAFALNPKTDHKVSDIDFKKMLNRLTADGRFFYTDDQLYHHAHRLISRKNVKRWRTFRFFLRFVLFFFAFSILTAFLGVPPESDAAPMIVLTMTVIFALISGRRSKPVQAVWPHQLIEKWRMRHPLEKRADGTAFKAVKNGIPEEFSNYAPQRILIVQHDDLADMLILNRYPADQQALVVSENRYPPAAFEACRTFLSQNPELPVAVLHDCSESGTGMVSRLKNDPDWGLAEREVTDLGLNPEDVDRRKHGFWIPEVMEGEKGAAPLPQRGGSAKQLEDGYRFPVALGAPQTFMGTLAAASALGAAFLSDELLAHQRSTGSDGFGFDDTFG